MQQLWWRGVLMVNVLLVVAGCAPQASPEPPSVGHVQQSIPPDSPLATIRQGVSKGEMLSVLGAPTDQETTVTGKAFIPFYFGRG